MLKKIPTWESLSLSLVIGLAAAMVTLVFLAWLSEEVLEGQTRAFDDTTRTAIHSFASPTLTTSMRVISFFGSTLFLIIATTAIVLLFILQRWRREAILLGLTMLGASTLNTTLKLAFQRPRPVPFFSLASPDSYSFPSGHALASFCFFGALAAILTARFSSRRAWFIIWTASCLLILLIGFSRIYLGVHYTTDVIAGYAAALIWVLTVNFVEQHLAQRRKRRDLDREMRQDRVAPS